MLIHVKIHHERAGLLERFQRKKEVLPEHVMLNGRKPEPQLRFVQRPIAIRFGIAHQYALHHVLEAPGLPMVIASPNASLGLATFSK